MEEKLNGCFILKLREIALRKITVILVNKPEYFSDTTNSLQKCYRRTWIQNTEGKIKDTLSKLLLPPSLLKEMIPIFKAVGTEILKWKLVHTPYLGEFDLYILKKLCWTTAGAIDYRKTSQELVNSDVQDIMPRFELACLYCLEDCIPSLWNKLPESNKRHFCNGRDPSLIDTPNGQIFLPYLLKKNSGRSSLPLILFRRHCFKYSAMYGSKTATEYSFKKLQERINPSVFQTTVELLRLREFSLNETLPDVLSYLLSLMTKEEQLNLFTQLPCEVLTCFLDWPFQDLCLDIADVIWTFLPESKYKDLLIMMKVHIRRLGYYLPNFFQELFLRCPENFRQCLLDEECQKVFFYQQFFDDEDFSSIQIIFNNIDATYRNTLVFSQKFLELFDHALRTNRRNFLEEFLRKAMLSNEELKGLKKAFKISTLNYSWPLDLDWAEKKKKRFDDFIDRILDKKEEQMMSH